METKNLHPMIAAQLKTILKRNDIRIEESRIPGTDTYKAYDPNGQELIEYVNGWDYGVYAIAALGKKVAYIQHRENDGKPTKEQLAVFEIGDLIAKKHKDQMSVAHMSENDKELMDMLQTYTHELTKQK